jgi:drug/metabolite transporter (DMT)-like permease
VVFAFGWGWLVFGASPDALSMAGAALIVVSTLLIGRRGRPR